MRRLDRELGLEFRPVAEQVENLRAEDIERVPKVLTKGRLDRLNLDDDAWMSDLNL